MASKKIGPSTKHADVASVLKKITFTECSGGQYLASFTERQRDAFDEAIERLNDRVAEGADDQD